ncbi:MAG: LysR family transcriptional regulator [Acidaminococcaceae bacterium]|jgi:DNA-binding transcriptional LysR family regulator|nr:LysR family transcriptional regulator [Acidaminococcaceae bacterium]
MKERMTIAVKITQLRYFSAACKLNSITKAAEMLFVSQPAITASIKSLEEEMGVSLLYRSKRAVMPTEEGERFLQRCDAILEDIDGLTYEFQNISKVHKSITVGIPPMIGYFLFPKVFSQFKKRYPGINIIVKEAGSETAKGLVKNGELELAVITMGSTQPPALNAEILGHTQLMYCVSKEHRLAKKETIDFSDIVGDPLILFTSGYYHELLLKNRFMQANITPNILFHSNQVMTIKGFIRDNTANGFLLPQVIEPEDHIVMLPFKDPLSINVAVVWRKDAFITKEADCFIRFVSSRFKQASSDK